MKHQLLILTLALSMANLTADDDAGAKKRQEQADEAERSYKEFKAKQPKEPEEWSQPSDKTEYTKEEMEESERIMAQRERQRNNWKPTKALDDIVGEGQPIISKRRAVFILFQRELVLQAGAMRKEVADQHALMQLTQVFPDVKPEKLVKLFKHESKDLHTTQ